MSQGDIGTLNPAQTSGTELADRLTSSHDAFKSMHSGSARPTYAVPGTLWLNTSSTPWRMMLYTGVLDAELMAVSPSTAESMIDKARVGLSNVNNTSDANKPISTATQTALNAKVDTSAFNTQLTGKVNALSNIASLRQAGIGGQWNQLQAVLTDGSLRKAVTDISSTNFIAMYYHGSGFPVIRVDASEFNVATRQYAESLRDNAVWQAGNNNQHDIREMRWVHTSETGVTVGWNGFGPHRPIHGVVINAANGVTGIRYGRLQGYSYDRGWFDIAQ